MRPKISPRRSNIGISKVMCSMAFFFLIGCTQEFWKTPFRPSIFWNIKRVRSALVFNLSEMGNPPDYLWLFPKWKEPMKGIKLYRCGLRRFLRASHPKSTGVVGRGASRNGYGLGGECCKGTGAYENVTKKKNTNSRRLFGRAKTFLWFAYDNRNNDNNGNDA